MVSFNPIQLLYRAMLTGNGKVLKKDRQGNKIILTITEEINEKELIIWNFGLEPEEFSIVCRVESNNECDKNNIQAFISATRESNRHTA